MSDADKGEEGTPAIPLIVGVLVAATIGYWIFSGNSDHHPSKVDGKPPATSHG